MIPAIDGDGVRDVYRPKFAIIEGVDLAADSRLRISALKGQTRACAVQGLASLPLCETQVRVA